MDSVYEEFLKVFHRENQEIESGVQKMHEFFTSLPNALLPFREMKISVTKLNNGKYFVSNGKSKGFFLERNSDIDKISVVSEEYKNFQKSIGKITDLFGLANRYFENIVEIFSNDNDSIGLGDFTSEFLERTGNERIAGEINIENLFTVAYEANGNRIVLNKSNHIYIYAHDLATHHYKAIKGLPQNTFYAIPQINTFYEFAFAFFEDFF